MSIIKGPYCRVLEGKGAFPSLDIPGKWLEPWQGHLCEVGKTSQMEKSIRKRKIPLMWVKPAPSSWEADSEINCDLKARINNGPKMGPVASLITHAKQAIFL